MTSEAVFLVSLGTRLSDSVVFQNSSYLAGNELVPGLTKNTASGNFNLYYSSPHRGQVLRTKAQVTSSKPLLFP